MHPSTALHRNIEDSIFAPRKQESDSGGFFDTGKVGAAPPMGRAQDDACVAQVHMKAFMYDWALSNSLMFVKNILDPPAIKELLTLVCSHVCK